MQPVTPVPNAQNMQGLNSQTQAKAHSHTPWQASIELGFACDDNRTTLKHRKHSGPLRVQKALWPESASFQPLNHLQQACHVILLHPPAGIAGGDQLSITVDVAPNAHGLVTTPGAGKWYGSDGRTAQQHIQLNVQQNGFLEWLPQEVILFNRAICNSQTQVDLQAGAAFLGWDMLMLGRHSRGEWFEQGLYQNHFVLQQNNHLLIDDYLHLDGNDRWLSSHLGMHNHNLLGTLWAVPPQHISTALLDNHITLMRELLVRMQVPVRVTRLNHMLVARYVGDDARKCLDAFAGLRAKIRQFWFNLPEAYPRIWKT